MSQWFERDDNGVVQNKETGDIVVQEDGTTRPMTDDEKRETLGIRRTRIQGCTSCDSYGHGKYSMGPPHDASNSCQSGKRSHCTCDTCF